MADMIPMAKYRQNENDDDWLGSIKCTQFRIEIGCLILLYNPASSCEIFLHHSYPPVGIQHLKPNKPSIVGSLG